VADLKGDCPKRNAAQLHERYGLICPDLPRLCAGQRATVLQLPAVAHPTAAKEPAKPEVRSSRVA
jgi:hypothetical protein